MLAKNMESQITLFESGLSDTIFPKMVVVGSSPTGVILDIEYWNNGKSGGMNGMVRSWQALDTGKLNIKIVQPREEIQKYVQYLWTMTDKHHRYVRGLRTIIKVNGKYIFMDSTDRFTLAAESWKLPFDLIIKFQHHPKPSRYKDAIAPIVPYTYTMSHYNMGLVHKCREKRREALKTREFTSSMFWAGSLITNKKQRERVRLHIGTMKYGKHRRLSYEGYMSELATTQIGVAVAGTGDFTHREIELSSVGNPFVRKTFFNITRNPRFPGVHYHSIGGHEVGIDRTLLHFRHYFEPGGEFRQFTPEEWEIYCEIGENTLKWYEKNASPQGSFNLFREILEENNIV